MNILIVDLSAIFWTAWHAKAGADISAAFDSTVGKVRRHASDYERTVIALDSPRSFRKALCDTYKANRPDKDAAAIAQLRRAEEVLTLDGFPMLRADGCEGDDVIASFCAWAKKCGGDMVNVPRPVVTILGCDKDLFQCLRYGVEMLHSMHDVRIDAEAIVNKYGVHPDQWIDFQTICGDSTDNVTGVKGVGAKGAAALLARHGALDRILDSARAEPTDDDGWKPAARAAFLASAEWLPTTRKLVTLRTDLDLDFGAALAERVQKPLAPVRTAEACPPADDDTTPEPAQETKMPPETEQTTTIEPKPEPTNGHALALAPTTPAVAPLVAKTNGAAMVDPTSPADPRYTLALEPRGLAQAQWLADQAFNSRAFGIPNAEFGLAAIMIGRSYGIGAMTMMRNVHAVKGKLALHAHLIIALVLASPLCESLDCVEHDAKHAVYIGRRRGSKHDIRVEYTIDDAKLAGLCKPDSNWATNPKPMLRKQAGVECCRLGWPDLTAGLYSPEELRGEDTGEMVGDFVGQ